MRKIEFPRLAVPLSTSLTALFNLVLNLVAGLRLPADRRRRAALALARAAAARRAAGRLRRCGLAMLLSALFVRYRDIEPIWDVVLQILFYASPIFFPIELLFQRDSCDWVAQRHAATRSRRSCSRRATRSSTRPTCR